MHGDLDSTGYCTAQFDGQWGRIPINFIQEMALHDQRAEHRLANQSLSLSCTPSIVDSEVDITPLPDPKRVAPPPVVQGSSTPTLSLSKH